MEHSTQGVISLRVPVKVIDAERPGYIQLVVMLCRLSPPPALFFIFLDDKNNYALELVKKYTLCM